MVRSKPPTFNIPLKLDSGFVFTCSWSDFFIPEADAWRDDAWQIIRATPHLTYQILTKRPCNVLDRLPKDWGEGWPNVWLGVTVENTAERDRIEHIRNIPAALRFVSFEPLLGDMGELNLRGIHWAIIGAESGPDARPCLNEWVREIVRQCEKQRAMTFIKQLHIEGKLSKDPLEWPLDLRLKQGFRMVKG